MLFERKSFVSHAGKSLDFKIECDALTDDDIETLAYVISEKFSFGSVVGIPRGGLRLANALEKYITTGPLLIVDDVLTTGTSMEEVRKKFNDDVMGVVIFARGECPRWIKPIFQMW